jgi:hypothetical protein
MADQAGRMTGSDRMPDVVALIPAKDRADSIAATVTAVAALDDVTRILVVDDGSTDATSDAARAAGAEVLRLPHNRGKGGAIAAGLAAAPDGDVYLLVDADVGDTARAVGALLAPVLAGDADMTIGVLPSAGGRGGFGTVKNLARRGIHRAAAFDARAPLSGQRAISGPLLRSLELAPRFGLETALTIDAVRAGARVVEVPVDMDHRHTGRRLAGFRHRARQGADIVRVLWPRLTTPRQRIAIIVAISVLLGAWMLWSGDRWIPEAKPLADRPSKVVLFGMSHLSFDDLGSGDVPNLDRLRSGGAVAAMSVRTQSGRPTTVEGYATLGAGTRVRARADAADAFDASSPFEGGTAGDVAARRTGRTPTGSIVVLGYPATVRLTTGKHLSSEPGALGDALHAAGLRTAVVGNADDPGSDLDVAPEYERPLAIALADRTGSVDTGSVERTLLQQDAAAPFGVRFDRARTMDAVRGALRTADVVAIDPGDLDRATAYRALSLDKAAETARRDALRRTDALLADVVRELPPDALLLVVSVSPPSGGWRLTPMVAAGAGIEHGYVNSPSVKRLGVVTVTDVAPTILRALGASVPDGMIGHSFRYDARPTDLGYLRNLDRDAGYRERIYFPITVVYIVVQALLYLFAMLVLGRDRGGRGIARFLRLAVLVIAAFPLATFVFRAIPEVARLGNGGVAVLLAIDALLVWLATRARRHALSPLSWLVWATAVLIIVDLATGARLQYSSLLGYSLHTAARFFGIGNTAFAALAASAAIAACIHVQYAPRRRDALVTAGALLVLAVIADGAPSLGDDVGGILTLVPVFGLMLVALSGRRLSWRTVGWVALALVVVLGLATGIDLLRPADSRTHLGRFVSDLFGGGSGESSTTVARKLATNVRVLGASIWTWMVPIIAVFSLFLLVYMDRGRELLPRGSALRIGAYAALAAGLLGFAVNDSGVVVTALVFVYLGPYLTLLALHADRGDPVLLPPAGVLPRARPGAAAQLSS